MTYFEQFIQYRALAFKFSCSDSAITHLERLVPTGAVSYEKDGVTVQAETVEEVLPIKVQNVCAKLEQPLVDRLDSRLSLLGMTKRDFIELALIEALDKVDQVLEQTDAFEYVETRANAGQEGK